MAKILIIDSGQALGKQTARVLSREGHEVQFHRYLTEALLRPEIASAQIIFVESDQIAADPSNSLSWLLEQETQPDVVVLVNDPNEKFHQKMIEAGALDVLSRNANPEKIKETLHHVLNYRASSRKDRENFLEDAVRICPGLVTSNNRFMECIKLAGQAARSDVNVLITGETGSGKELIAQVIHELSDRSKGNLVLVDCAALPDNLIESTLFGHVRGAFTGAERTQEGLISQAHGGTLFLDEVGELPLLIQKSFLRVLDEQTYRPVGSQNLKRSDFRVIAATNRDLKGMVSKSLFREDLLHRLMVISILVPPLRDRREDIPLLAEHHVQAICRRHGIARVQLSPEFIIALGGYPWPGNVRELINALERSIVAAGGGGVLYPFHLPSHIRSRQGEMVQDAGPLTETRPAVGTARPPRQADRSERKIPEPFSFPPLQEEREAAIRQIERDYLERLMEHTRGNISQAVRISGLSRSRLYGLMKQYGVRRFK